MNIKPIASPHAMSQAPSNAQAARDKAISAFMGGNQPPVNQNAIAPEDMGAIIPASNDQEDSGQTDTSVETAPAAPEVKPAEKAPEDSELSRQFAQLARQEKQMRLKAQQQEQTIKAREAELAAREAAIAAKDQEYRQGYVPKAKFAQDPLTALAEMGITYDQIAEQAINHTPVNPQVQATIDKLTAQIEELKQRAESSEKTYKDQQTSAYKAAIKQISSDVTALVKTNAEFETIKATGSEQEVVDLIEQTYQKDGILLTVEEAAMEVENYLLEEALKLSNLDKIKKRLAQGTGNQAPNAPSKPAGETKQPQPQTQMRTLTNATSSTRQLSARERAIAAFRGDKA